MVALTTGANRPYRYLDQDQFKVAANTHIYMGALLQFSGGYIIPAKSGANGDETLVIAGVAEETVDNNPGAAGAKSCLVRLPNQQEFRFATNVDLTDAMIHTVFDVLDDNTLQATAANAARLGVLRLSRGDVDDVATLEPLYLRPPAAVERAEAQAAANR